MFSTLRRQLAVTALLLAFAAAVVALSHWKTPTPSTREAANASLAGSKTEDLKSAAMNARAGGSAGAARSASTPASVRQILPRLEQRIDDWREFRPQQITIAPYADLALEFEMTSVREEDGRTIWRGRNALSGAFLVAVATQNEWHAVLDIPAAGGFEFHISGQSASVGERNAPVLCGSEQASVAAGVAGKVLDAGSPAPDDAPSHGDEANVVDVLFFYDAGTFSASGSNPQAVDTTIAAAVEAANVVLQNSAVANLRWHYAGAYQVPDYAATDKLQHDLDLITSTDNAVGRFISEKCSLHGADQAVLYVDRKRSDNYDGLAWVPNDDGSVAHGSALVWNSGYVVLAHEMAHNFGCHHDRKTEGAAADDRKYSYGFTFTLNGVSTGTVMSYAPVRVPFFSGAESHYAGVRLGVPADRAGAADNSRVLRTNASAMAVYRDAPAVPVITEQPRSATVGQGVGFTLSVMAAGDGLTFQWRKNGVDLPGANQSTYSKASASSADDGTYNVVVANDVGQTSSANASVVVAGTASASVAAASGGSGGGAPGPWVLAALAIISSVKLIGFARRNW